MMGFNLSELRERLKLGDKIEDYALAYFEGETLFYNKKFEAHKKSLEYYKEGIIDLY